MEYKKMSVGDGYWHVEGHPDAVKVIGIDGPKTNRLKAMALHTSDLIFAEECVNRINYVSDDPPIIRQALWHSAIFHYYKCFGKSRSRSPLSATKIYKKDAGGLRAFNFFKNLRNKHLAHDENSYSQSLLGGILNRQGVEPKIAQVICFSVDSVTLGQANYGNMSLLIKTTKEWVEGEFDRVSELVKGELEQESWDDLYGREGLKYSPPNPDFSTER